MLEIMLWCWCAEYSEGWGFGHHLLVAARCFQRRFSVKLSDFYRWTEI